MYGYHNAIRLAYIHVHHNIFNNQKMQDSLIMISGDFLYLFAQDFREYLASALSPNTSIV